MIKLFVTIAALLTGAFYKKHLLLLAAVLGLGLYVGAKPKAWNLFHYWLNSKYFYALGYEGLYPCAAQNMPRGWAEHATDLRSYEWVTVGELGPCPRENFRPGDWGHFLAEYQGLIINNDLPPNVLLDKGLNTTPFWIFFSERLAGLQLFTIGPYFDVALLLLGLAAVYWACGGKVTGLAALFILGFWGTYGYLYGSWLQYPWLAALMVALACWKKGKYYASGLFFALAIGLRIFPAFLLIGPLLNWKQIDRRFWIGLGAGLLAVFIIGLLTTAGAGAWLQWFEKIRLHSIHAVNEPLDIGFRNLAQTVLNPSQAIQHYQDFATGRVTGNYPPTHAVLVFLLSFPLIAWSFYTAGKRGTLAAGLPLLFTALVLSRYYWLVLVVALVEDEKARPWIMLLAASGLALTTWDFLGGWLLFQFLLFIWLFAFYGTEKVYNASIRNRWITPDTA